MASRMLGDFVAGEIVHHNDIALAQDGTTNRSTLARKLGPSIGPSNTPGAAISPTRSAATKVVVFHCPHGTLDTRR